jgi:hypothetical protein
MIREVKSKICNIVAMAVMLLLLMGMNGCASSKKGAVSNGVSIKELKSLSAINSNISNLSAKIKLSAKIDGKEFSANGNIKIKRGEGLIISINALGGLIEVGRVEMTSEKMLLIYRLGREYAEVRYKDVAALNRLGINYSMLEAILLNELFVSEGKSIEKELAQMDVTVANGEILLSTERKNGIKYSFHIEQSSGCLQLTQGDYNSKVNVNCNYSDFVDTDGRLFPRQVRFSVANSLLELKFTNLKTDNFKLNRTTELSSYKKVDISTLLKGIEF